ncbi:hypothetical protein QR680_009228 [Steinernema hermaphroditum]|uniref:Uncharacterized protein n=1 Tax=Steinernema hermaphroditum TaxID=289476 RepID=A0AA39M9I4_9BILA|nr:hypothetical protein QR680_009228 [Steinernema hermaphroditum]
MHQLQQDPELWEDVKVREFAGYITSYWMPLIPYINYGPSYDGPTTTNHVEGFHRPRRRKIDIEKSIKAGHAAMIGSVAITLISPCRSGVWNRYMTAFLSYMDSLRKTNVKSILRQKKMIPMKTKASMKDL